jgi:hypothetical protein
MNLKPLARKLLLIVLLGSCALIVWAQLQPLYSKPSPPTTVSLWQTCETLAGVTSCFSQYVKSSSQCSEMDSRLSMMVTFCVIWFVNNLEMCLVLIWELLGKQVPIGNLQLMMFGWSAGSGAIVVVLLLHTLVAKLCGSPLNFSEQGGKYEQGGMFLSIALGATVVGFLMYFAAPEEDDVEQEPLTRGPAQAAAGAPPAAAASTSSGRSSKRNK